ncbi:MAG: hypothetical protein JRI55_18765 [Deltaproteobacteria bacterium]|jgi:hypothetical protein|nr:hypothetical protein [Deltaproteobacteria bacterium]
MTLIKRIIAVPAWVVFVAACSSDKERVADGAIDAAQDAGRDAAVDQRSDLAPPDAKVDGETDGPETDGPQVKPEDFVGTWRFLRTECEQSPPITFLDYTLVLELELTKATSHESTPNCTLTTEHIPLVPEARGYHIAYGLSGSLTCDPNPCTLSMRTKIGTEITEASYTCPDDFPQPSSKEVIVSVQGSTLTTLFDGTHCASLFERVQP